MLVRRLLAASAALALGLGGALVVAAPAAAAPGPYEVKNLNDAGADSLRDAIDQANNNPGLDTISFASGLIGTITLATVLDTITDDLTIVGPGEADLTIDSTLGTVFEIAGGTPNIAVSFSDLTISSPAAGACGIDSDNADVTVTNVTASDFDCSGISVTDGSLSATDVTVEDDATGIAFRGSDPAHSLTLTRVHAAGAAFSGVNAVVNGGVATVSDVDADDAALFGFYLGATSSATATISGVHAARSGIVGITVLTDLGAAASLSDSSADDGGGQGINLQSTGSSSLTASRISSTNSSSGGFWLSSTNSGSVTVQSSIVQDTQTNSGIWVDRVDNASLSISGTHILNNSSSFGGGIFVREATGGATLGFSGLTVSGNDSGDDGGGIDVNTLQDDGTTLTISDSTISNNTSVDFGAGLYLRSIGNGVTSTAHVVVQRTTFDGNSAGGYGGAIAITDPAAETSGQPTVLIDSSTISNNTTPYGGGGIHIRRGSSGDPAIVKITNTTIVDNESQVGGGVSAFSANYGVPSGPFGPIPPGPLLLTTVISHSTITGNSAHTSGGVATSSGDQSVEIDNSIIAGSVSDTNDPTINDLEIESELPYSVRYSLVQTPKPGVVVAASDGNLVGVDPQLGPLANNGGPTMTRLVAPGSPAYNAGDPSFTGAGLFDQRGQARVYQVVDLGAVEWQPALAKTGSTPPAPETPLIGLLLLFSGLAMVAFSRLQLARA